MEWWHILLIVVAILTIALVALYFYGKKIQSQADSQQSLIEQSKVTTKILVIDKKKMKLKDSKLPQMVQDQVPWYFKWQKMPLVKAKIGPKIQTLICDGKVFDDLPVKKTVKVDIAGLYIVGIKGGVKNTAKKPEKKGFNWKFWEKK